MDLSRQLDGGTVNDLAFDARGSRLAVVAAVPGGARLLVLAARRPAADPLLDCFVPRPHGTRHVGGRASISFSADGARVAAAVDFYYGSEPPYVRAVVAEVRAGAAVRALTDGSPRREAHLGSRAVATTGDRTALARGTVVELFDSAAGGAPLAERTLPHGQRVQALAWSPDGATLVAATTGAILLLDGRTLAERAMCPTPNSNKFCVVTTEDAAAAIASGGLTYSGRPQVYAARLRDGARLHVARPRGTVEPFGARLVWIDPRGRSLLWSRATGALVRHTLRTGAFREIRGPALPAIALTRESDWFGSTASDGRRVARSRGARLVFTRLVARR